MNSPHRALFLFCLSGILMIAGIAGAQSPSEGSGIGGKVDGIQVVFASEGTAYGSPEKKVTLAFVKLHKYGVPPGEWGKPLLYFEFQGRSFLETDTSFEYQKYRTEDGQLRTRPVLSEIHSALSDFKFTQFGKQYRSDQGTPVDYELHLVFTSDGQIQINQSAIYVVPPEHQHGKPSERTPPRGDEIIKTREVCLENKGRLAFQSSLAKSKNESVLESNESFSVDDVVFKPTGLCKEFKISRIEKIFGKVDARGLGLVGSRTKYR